MFPDPDGVLRAVVRKKILHYHQLYINHPDPIVFIPQLTLQSVSTMTLFVYCTYMIIVKNRVGLTKYGGIGSISFSSCYLLR
jgi:hypothetical protein